jgi:hypothetical protein
MQTRTNAELEVFKYTAGRWMLAEFDRADTQAVTEASKAAYKAEVDFLEEGLERACQSPAAAALLARHVERVANINDRRITRRFGC